MKLSDLWNELSAYPMSENVEIDATGIRIGRDRHVEVPLAADLTPPAVTLRGDVATPLTLRWDRDRHSFDVV